jgi:Fe2+ transport system protein FeoA
LPTRPDSVRAFPAQAIRLDRLPPGLCATVSEVAAGEDETARLMAMGVCTGRRVMLVQNGDPLILKVLGSRIGVSARLAARVSVVPCDDGTCRTG